jgi:hypothetical protein
MSDISDIKIIGIDKDRPPRIRKEAYIDLFFRLSQKGSVAWCEDFNALGRKINPSPKIDIHKGECIETYVKNMTQIEQHLTDVKALLRDCNEQFQAKVDEKARVLAASNASLLVGQEGEQYKLNQIVEGLNFDD